MDMNVIYLFIGIGFVLTIIFFYIISEINGNLKIIKKLLKDIYSLQSEISFDVSEGSKYFHYINDKQIKIKKTINLLAEPKNHSKIICSLLVGEKIELLNQKEIDGSIWLNVKDNNNNDGWIFFGNK